MTCSYCQKEVDVVWLVAPNKQSCFNCLYPHERLLVLSYGKRNEK